MNGQENTPTSSLLCANGCGFYGSPTTRNLCSKCYREFLMVENQMKQQQQSDTPAVRSNASVAMNSPTEPPGESQEADRCSNPLDYTSLVQCDRGNPLLPTEQDSPSSQFPSSSSSSSSEHAVVVESYTSHLSTDLVSTNVDGNVAATSNSSRLTNLTSSTVVSASDAHPATGPDATQIVEDQKTTTTSSTTTTVFPAQTNKARCFKCNKKVGLLGFSCRCGYSFCSSHRHADQHQCHFDYRELARQQLAKANQKVVADKLNRI